MKVYIAGRYARRDEFREVAKKLKAEANIDCTSRWLDESEPLNSQMGEHSEEFYIETAQIDLEDVDSADVVLFFSEDPLQGWVRGGRHVEFGYAIARGKSVCVVGPRENVFHYTPKVINFFSVDQFLKSYTEQMQFVLGLIRSQKGEDAYKIARKKLSLEWLPDVQALNLDNFQEKGGDESDIFGG